MFAVSFIITLNVEQIKCDIGISSVVLSATNTKRTVCVAHLVNNSLAANDIRYRPSGFTFLVST